MSFGACWLRSTASSALPRYVATLSLVLLLCLPFGIDGASRKEWHSRRIYQIMTDRFAQTTYDKHAPCNVERYCGGTFDGATHYLPYIAEMGFDAIWISPVPVNYHEGYHGYWATDFFAINPHFGTEDSLKAFVRAAHAMGMFVMVDVVVNHVGPVGTNFSGVLPFNHSTHYHTECQVKQYVCETQEVQLCRLADLPDLNQTVPFVREQLQRYVLWLLSEFAFDGIRADTVMYIDNDYWVGLQKAAGTYIVGEVWADFACNLNYTKNGIDSTLNYPLFDAVRDVFYHRHQSMRLLGTVWRQQLEYPDPNGEVNFVDNQDNSRFLNNTDATQAQYRSAMTHLYFTNGIPCIFYGTEQLYAGGIQDNYCREPLWWSGYNNQTHMYRWLKLVNEAHKLFKVWEHEVKERWQDETIYCFIRGVLLVCTTNQLTEQTRTIPNLQFDRMTVCDWLDSTAPCTTGASTMAITVPAGGEPLILYGTSS